MENQIKSSFDKQRVLCVKVLVVSSFFLLLFDIRHSILVLSNYEDREMTLLPFCECFGYLRKCA